MPVGVQRHCNGRSGVLKSTVLSLDIIPIALEKAEIIPGKDSDTRIKPLTLTNGHGRYMAVTPERTLASVGKCPLNI